MSNVENDIFDRLPSGLFRPLASQRQRLHWHVLVRLYRALFDEEIDISEYGHARAAVIDTIVAVLEKHWVLWIDDPADMSEDTSQRGRANYTFNKLREAGWLEEERRGYHDYVTMAPRVNQCLGALIEISEGRALIMTGKLKSLQAGMREVLANPEDQADTLMELAKDAGRFSRHLNSIRGAIKGLYDHIRGDIAARDIVASFFDNFLREIFVRDYTTIKTTENPLVIRDELLSIVAKLRYGHEAKEALLQGYRRLYVAEENGEPELRLEQDLSRLEQVFMNIERQLDAIDTMKVRYEQRVDTVIDYATRSPRTLGKDLQRLSRALVRHAGITADITVRLPFVGPETIGEARLARTQRPRQEPAPRVVRKQTLPEQARLRSERERAARQAIQVDDEALTNFLDAQLGNRHSEETHRFIVRNIRDYFCVLSLQRAARAMKSSRHQYPTVFKHYALAPTDNWAESDYFKMRKVIITRKDTLP